MCKNLPNLQPTVAVWQSLVYGADIISWVIISLKPLCVCFILRISKICPDVMLIFPRLPWDPLGLLSLALMEMLSGWCLPSHFSAPDPCTELRWMSQGMQQPPPRPVGFQKRSGVQDPRRRTQVAPSWLGNGSHCWCYKSLLDTELPCRPEPRVCCPWLILKAE